MSTLTLLASLAIAATVPFGARAADVDASAATPVGVWKTIDDATGEPKALVRIDEESGTLSGKTIRLFRKPDEKQDPTCDDCDGARRGQPVLGMTILWGLKRDGDAWSGGEILDPKTGKVYRANLHVVDGGRKLEVRGYVGFSLLGRTQVWLREADAPPA